MSKHVIVQRSEGGNRTEYRFKSLKDALEFIETSERGNKKACYVDFEGGRDVYPIDGEYELYMPRSYG